MPHLAPFLLHVVNDGENASFGLVSEYLIRLIPPRRRRDYCFEVWSVS